MSWYQMRPSITLPSSYPNTMSVIWLGAGPKTYPFHSLTFQPGKFVSSSFLQIVAATFPMNAGVLPVVVDCDDQNFSAITCRAAVSATGYMRAFRDGQVFDRSLQLPALPAA